MPALPPVPGVFRYLIHWAVGGDTSISTRIYWGYTGTPPTNAALQAHAVSVDAAAAAAFPPVCFANTAYLGLDVYDLSSASGAHGSVVSSHPGTRAGPSLDAGACALFNSTIARRYRGGKPRHYFPFGTANDLASPQTWNASALTAFLNAYTSFISAITTNPPAGTSTTQEVNVSYYSGFKSVQNPVTGRWKNLATPRAVPVVDTLTSRKVNPLIGSQRRRINA